VRASRFVAGPIFGVQRRQIWYRANGFQDPKIHVKRDPAQTSAEAVRRPAGIKEAVRLNTVTVESG
jgi:hypothetical protein